MATRFCWNAACTRAGARRPTQRNRNFPFDPSKLDAVILSHAHIDHSGNLPNLVKCGYHGPIYATPATAHLANIMLLDSAHIQEADAEYVNKKNAKQGRAAGGAAVHRGGRGAGGAAFSARSTYDQPFEVAPGVTATLVDAGHILGSAAVVLDIEETAARSSSASCGCGSRAISGGATCRCSATRCCPSRADVLIMECTYGDKPHDDPQAGLSTSCARWCGRTIQRGGKVIIPAFAVGRTQELVYDLHQMMDGGRDPARAGVRGQPAGGQRLGYFQAHPECFDEETRQFIAQDQHRAALGFDRLTYTRSVEESKALNERKEPMIIISASGMAENGRILHHLKNNIENPRNTILIVSWQAPDTLGRRLADREKQVTIFGESYEVRAEVATIGGLSAHAGQNFLVEYARATQGDREADLPGARRAGTGAGADARSWRSRGMRKVVYPELHAVVEI